MARDFILVTWAISAGVVATIAWNNPDTASAPWWERAGGSALLGAFGGGIVAVVAILAAGLVDAVL